MKKVIIFIGAVAFLQIAGCDNAVPQKQPQKTEETQVVETPLTTQIETEEVPTSREYQETKTIRENFTIGGIKFSLNIPKGFWVADYSRSMNGVTILDSAKKYSLNIVRGEFNADDGMTFEEAKNHFLQSASGEKVSGKSWHGQGYEIFYQFLDEKNLPDLMSRSNRIFIFPAPPSYLILNETAPSVRDASISSAMKTLADSLEVSGI